MSTILTDDEIEDAWCKYGDEMGGADQSDALRIGREIEAAVLAKLTQEPVAWMTYESKHRLSNGGNCKGAVPVHKNPSSASCVPLYTAPQHRPEVELTDEDYIRLAKTVAVNKHQIRAVIAAYKEKNK